MVGYVDVQTTFI